MAAYILFKSLIVRWVCLHGSFKKQDGARIQCGQQCYGPYNRYSSATQRRHKRVGYQCTRRGTDGTSRTMG